MYTYIYILLYTLIRQARKKCIVICHNCHKNQQKLNFQISKLYVSVKIFRYTKKGLKTWHTREKLLALEEKFVPILGKKCYP